MKRPLSLNEKLIAVLAGMSLTLLLTPSSAHAHPSLESYLHLVPADLDDQIDIEATKRKVRTTVQEQLKSEATHAAAKKGGGNVGGAERGGGNVGGSDRSSQSQGSIYELAPLSPSSRNESDSFLTDSWCEQSTSELQDAVHRATIQAKYGNPAGARDALRGGILRSIRNAETAGISRSMSLRMARKLLFIDEQLYEFMLSYSDRNDRSIEFLYRGISIISEIAHEIDRPYFIPYTFGHPIRSGIDSHLLKYGKKQLQWLYEYTRETSAGYTTHFDADIFLLLGQYLSGSVANDLMASNLGASVSCQINDLRMMSRRIAEHNAGGSIYMNNDREAVNDTVPMIKNILLSLENPCRTTR